MTDNGKTVFSKRIPGGKNRNYFIDVRQSDRTGNKYLVMSESRNQEGNWSSSRVMIFPDHVGEWKDCLDEALQALSS